MNIQPALDPLLTADTPATLGKGSLASVLVSTGHRECGPQGHPHICPAQLSCCLGVETPLPPLPWMSCVLPSPQNPCLHAWDLSYQVCKMCRRGNHHLASSLLSLGIGSPWKGLSLRGQQSARPRGRSLRNIESKRGVALHAPEVHSRSSQSTSRGCESVHLFLSPKPGPFHPVLLNPACTPQSEGSSGIERRPRCPWRSLSQPPLLWCPRGVLPFAPAPSASTAPAPSVSVAGCFVIQISAREAQGGGVVSPQSCLSDPWTQTFPLPPQLLTPLAFWQLLSGPLSGDAPVASYLCPLHAGPGLVTGSRSQHLS